jgi:hypothetical protein
MQNVRTERERERGEREREVKGMSQKILKVNKKYVNTRKSDKKWKGCEL